MPIAKERRVCLAKIRSVFMHQYQPINFFATQFLGKAYLIESVEADEIDKPTKTDNDGLHYAANYNKYDHIQYNPIKITLKKKLNQSKHNELNSDIIERKNPIQCLTNRHLEQNKFEHVINHNTD